MGEQEGVSRRKRVLMIAFHFPPIAESSGFLRTTCFARYLRHDSWSPIVLTASTRAYSRIAIDNNDLVRNLEVYRSFALDAKRHLSVWGKYLRITALPDQWANWTVSAVLRGLILVRKKRPSVVWSTFPIPTALLIGYCITRISGVPWVADIRDVIVDDEFPETDIERRVYSWLERLAVEHASALVVATSNAAAIYRERYPQATDKIHVIRNGYDEAVISKIEDNVLKTQAGSEKIKLVHSGLLSPTDRDPIPFLDALSELLKCGSLNSNEVSFVFRAPGNEEQYSEEIRKRGLDDLVKLMPPVPYVKSLAEMITADGLLLFQGGTCNHAVPAKVYEYLRCGVPVFGAVDPAGETSSLLSKLGCRYLADISLTTEINAKLSEFLNAVKSGDAFVPARQEIAQFSRQRQARQLEDLLDGIAD